LLPELLAHEAVDEAVAGTVQDQQEVTDVTGHQWPQRECPLAGCCANLENNNVLSQKEV